ncbi:MAG: nuclear transport factor 2 family protein [Acidimicrobiia bacterium]
MTSARRLGAEDTLEIQAVLQRYAFALDDRDWDAMREVFTDDAEWLGAVGLDGVIHELQVHTHPYQHVIANHLMEAVSDDEVIVRSKALFPVAEGRVLEAVYRDVVVRTPAGWKIRHKSATRYDPELGATNR